MYENADTQKLLILLDNKNKSGVYRWVDKINGKTYIGSSVNLSRRLSDYFNVNYLIKGKSYIHNALLKRGYFNFSLEILEYCEKKSTILREQFYIDLMKPEYNILKQAGSSLGYRHTEETLAKMASFRAIKLGKANPMFGKKGERHHRYGIKFSDETLKKMSKKKLGAKNPMFGKKHTEDARGKLSIPIQVLNTNTGEIKVYKSGKASIYFCCSGNNNKLH